MVEELSHLTGVATGRISRRSSRILTSQGFWHVSLNVFKFITNSKTAKTAIFINPSMSPKKVQICIKLSKKQGDMGVERQPGHDPGVIVPVKKIWQDIAQVLSAGYFTTSSHQERENPPQACPANVPR